MTWVKAGAAAPAEAGGVYPLTDVNPTAANDRGPPRIRLLTYNIHVGVGTSTSRHYLTRAWRHALPGPGMRGTLDRMAELMQDYDIVAVQEADAGSLRSQFVNQLEYLARRAGFAHIRETVTRNLRPVARHSLGVLSRFAPKVAEAHVLPADIPGRRALDLEFGPEAGQLRLVVAHLSLGPSNRSRQLDYLGGLIPGRGPVVLAGDLNCGPEVLREHGRLHRLRLSMPDRAPLTFPSWRPRRSLDHILVSDDIRLAKLEALPHRLSDHLPLAAELQLPGPK